MRPSERTRPVAWWCGFSSTTSPSGLTAKVICSATYHRQKIYAHDFWGMEEDERVASTSFHRSVGERIACALSNHHRRGWRGRQLPRSRGSYQIASKEFLRPMLHKKEARAEQWGRDGSVSTSSNIYCIGMACCKLLQTMWCC